MTLLGLILEFLARILAALEADLGAPVFHFEGPGALRGSILSILQQFCRIYENHGKTQVFSWFFFDFEGSGVIKIGRKCDKIRLGVSWNAKKIRTNSVGATGLARLVAQMVFGQRNGGQNECSRGGEPAPTREVLSGPGPRGGEGEGLLTSVKRLSSLAAPLYTP